MYVSNQVRDEKAGEGPSINLIKALIPAYDKVLFPPPDEPTAATASSAEPNPPKPASSAKPTNG